jgi:hypothetical protein
MPITAPNRSRTGSAPMLSSAKRDASLTSGSSNGIAIAGLVMMSAT